jgi:CrcB protein
MNYLWIALGGALGSVFRFAISKYIHSLISTIFPAGTLLVNLSGCLLIGYLWGINSVKPFEQHLSSFLFIGILGGFTTFSTFSVETLQLIREGAIRFSLLYIAASCIGGLLMAYWGLRLAIHNT